MRQPIRLETVETCTNLLHVLHPCGGHACTFLEAENYPRLGSASVYGTEG